MRVFLSHHAQSEAPLARRIGDDLARRGIPVRTAGDADPGATRRQAIEDRLRASTHVVVLVADGVFESDAVRHELQLVELLQLDGRVVLVPALLDRVELPPWLHTTQPVDFTGAYADGRDALLTTLRRTAARTTTAEHPTVHRVRRGDRIDLIAARYLGEPTLWRLIAEDNPGVDVSALEPGTLVSIRARGR